MTKQTKLMSDDLKAMIQNIIRPGTCANNELVSHGCPPDATFIWKRIDKRKISVSDDDYSFLLPLAGETDAEGWVHPDFSGAKVGVHWIRTFLLKEVKCSKHSLLEDDEFCVPDAHIIFITDSNDTQVLAWILNVD